MENKLAIRQFIERLLAQKGDRQPFRDSDSLILNGRLQSVDAVEVVVFLEEQWSIDFTQIGFDHNQIDSVDAILALIESVGASK